uniref:NADH dehydrogenase subunit 6 n=1 Tax=Reticulinasus faini TaxID=1811739 RepID=UPI000738FF6A|nr:NADH dehydrogenase subunit 6 [Reticulinasus faini]AIZ58554.1 NADH dehydrogenase subunit 6 [Reticulinasus faini]
MKLIMILIMCFISSTHPILMILTMIMTSLMLNMYMYMYIKHSWFLLIITLLILGGLLVIFLYITSLTPNKKFNMKKIIFFTPLIILIENQNLIMNCNSNNQIMNLFTPNSLLMLILTLSYLILSLISIMNLIQSNMIPLKQQ